MPTNEYPTYEALLNLFGPQEKPLSEKVIIERLQAVNDILGPVRSDHRLAPRSLYNDPILESSLSHEIFSEEYFDAMGVFLRDLRDKSESQEFSVLEIGAGNGEFGKHLQTRIPDIPLRITDPYADVSDFVEKIDYLEALERYHPTIVIAVWPHYYIYDVDQNKDPITEYLRKTSSVQGCILVGAPDRCRFDNRWFHTYFPGDRLEFSNMANMQELSKKQIVLPKDTNTMRVRNGVNPLLVGDQGIYESITRKGNTAVSRTYFLYRKVPGW